FPVNRHVQRIVQSWRSLRVGRQNFDNLSLLVRSGIAIANHLVSTHHHLDHVSAFWTTNHNAPAKSKIPDLFVIECEVIDAMGAIEQRDTLGFHLGVLWRGKNGEDDHNRAGLKPGVAMNRGKIDARRERKAKRPCSPIGIQSIADYGLMLPKVCQFAEAATCDLGGQVRRSRQQYNSVGNASTSQKRCDATSEAPPSEGRRSYLQPAGAVPCF